MWEYMIIRKDAGQQSGLLEKLDECGDAGWELISVVLSPNGGQIIHYLKRKRKAEAKPSRAAGLKAGVGTSDA